MQKGYYLRHNFQLVQILENLSFDGCDISVLKLIMMTIQFYNHAWVLVDYILPMAKFIIQESKQSWFF